MNSCPYCQEGAALDRFAIKITDISAYSSLYLFKEQSHPGRVIIAYKKHVSEIADLSAKELQEFMADVAHVARTLHAVFNPQKINYGAYGDLNPHLHFHLVPKYKDAFEWGSIFQMNPQKVLLSDQEYAELIAKITAALPKNR